MAKNYIKLINDMKKDIPLLKDFIYEDFNLINDYELTNAIKFESFIRTDEIKTLIKNIEQELISIEEKRTINLLKKENIDEINLFYSNLLKEEGINIENPVYCNTYDDDCKIFGYKYNRALEEFYKRIFKEKILPYYIRNQQDIDSILNKYGIDFISLIHKRYNIFAFSYSYVERDEYSLKKCYQSKQLKLKESPVTFYYKLNLDTEKNENVDIKCENFKDENNGNREILHTFAKVNFSRPQLHNINSTIVLNIDLATPLNEITNYIDTIKNSFEIINLENKYNELCEEVMNKPFSYSFSLQKNIENIKNHFYIIDTYDIIKEKIPDIPNKKIFEFLKTYNAVNDCPMNINDISTYNSTLKKRGNK